MDGLAGGYEAYLGAFAEGLEPDPELWLDSWCEAHMEIPREISANPGPYRFDRTPVARALMQWLSPAHPCQRVVVVAPSQLMKTQVALNAICGWIDAAPGNILALEPTLGLAKRLSNRVGKTFNAVRKLIGKVAQPRSRDARNTLDTKEFDGGTLYITTAGSASNLAEIMVRYLYGDEIDRWEGDVGGEGDPVKLAENRTTTYRYRRKMYYSSSPVRPGTSRIMRLFEQGTQNVVLVPCPHCGEYQELTLDGLQYEDDLSRAWFVCMASGCVIEEAHKAQMVAAYRLRPMSAGDGETESLRISAFYALDGLSWLDLAKEYVTAEAALESGVENPHALMQVFYNTRLAMPYSVAVEVADTVELANRAEDYPPESVPVGGLVLTAGVDVQHDRLALIIRAWGRGEESWLVHWGEIGGETRIPNQGAWLELEKWLFQRAYRHAGGSTLNIRSVSLDSGDGVTQEAVYAFVRKWQRRGARATKGASERSQDKREIFASPRAIDTDRKHKAWKYGLQLYMVGTNAAKNLLLKARLPLKGTGAGRLHWYKGVRPDYWDQLTSEVEVPHPTKRGRKVWDVKAGVRNEALDCEILALHAARAIKTHLAADHVWAALEHDLRQAGLFARQPEVADAEPGLSEQVADAKVPAVVTNEVPHGTVAPAQPRLAEPTEETTQGWIPANDNWLD